MKQVERNADFKWLIFFIIFGLISKILICKCIQKHSLRGYMPYKFLLFNFFISIKCVLSYSLYSISEHHKRSAIDAGQIRASVCSSDLKVSTSAGDTAVLWFQPGRTNVWAQEGSHRLGGAKSSHTHRICKDFNNEPLSPNHGDRSGVNKGPVHMQIRPRAVAIKQQPPVWAGRTHSLWH